MFNYEKTKLFKRRSFFSTLGKGFAGVILLNVFPIKLFTRKQVNKNKSIKVTAHPLAVKYGTRKVNRDE